MRIGITKSANVTPLCCLLALKQMHGARLMQVTSFWQQPLHLSHLQCQNGCPYHYYPFTDYLIFLPVIILVRKHGCMFLSTQSSPVPCAEPAGHIITASQSYSNMSNLTMGQQNETTQKSTVFQRFGSMSTSHPAESCMHAGVSMHTSTCNWMHAPHAKCISITRMDF